MRSVLRRPENVKIRDVKTYVLDAALAEPFAYSQAWYERRGACLVEIVGEDGNSGWGEAFGPARLTAPIVDYYKPLLIGEDALATERHWQNLYNRLRDHGQKGLAIEALSAVDIALWDLKGRHLGVSVHRLLGGPLRNRVEAYATGFYRKRHGDPLDYLVAEANERVAAGFTAIKLKLGYGLDADVRDGAPRGRSSDIYHGRRQPRLRRAGCDPARQAHRTTRHILVRGAGAARGPRRLPRGQGGTRHPDRRRRGVIHPLGLPRADHRAACRHIAARHRGSRWHLRDQEDRRHGQRVRRQGQPACLGHRRRARRVAAIDRRLAAQPAGPPPDRTAARIRPVRASDPHGGDRRADRTESRLGRDPGPARARHRDRSCGADEVHRCVTRRLPSGNRHPTYRLRPSETR